MISQRTTLVGLACALALGRGRPLPEDFAPPFLAFRFTTFLDDFFAATLAFATVAFATLDFLRVAIVCFLSLKPVLRCVSMALHYFFRTVLCGLRLPIRPLSLPAAIMHQSDDDDDRYS